MRLVYWLLIAVPLFVAATLFTISNLNSVELRFWPLPFAKPVPVFLLAFVALAIGFFAGGIVAWFSAGRARARARAAERTIRIRDIEIEELRRQVQEAERANAAIKQDAPATGLPAPVEAVPGR